MDSDESPPPSPSLTLMDAHDDDQDSLPPSPIDFSWCDIEQATGNGNKPLLHTLSIDKLLFLLHIEESESESEPAVEVWDEDDHELKSDLEPPDTFDSATSFDAVPSSSRTLATWILRFLMVMQAAFKLPDVVIGHFLRFFNALFTIIGRYCKIGGDIVKCLPNSVYKVKQLVGELKFERFVVCKKCFSIYTLANCIEDSGSGRRSKHCSFQRFPLHPYLSMRSPCGAQLLKTVELASRQTYLYPILMYCYLGVDVSLQSLFDRPMFYSACEQWRTRVAIDGELRDVYDGKMWQKFANYEGERFLSEAGNIGFILNFDFFQPYDHLAYSLGAIYMSVLNLPREIRYKQENTILVGLIPGPHEPSRDINSFLKPLVNDLNRLWRGVDMRVSSIKCVKKIRCALMCVACDLPAGRKICGFLGHSAKLGCSRCFKEFAGTVGKMDYSGFDRQNWQPRTHAVHNTAAFTIRGLRTATAINSEESKTGCRYSELLLLPYFDAPKMLIIDPMHNLFLGSAKYFLKNILVPKGYISDAQLGIIQDRVDSFIVPSGVGRIPLKIQSGFSQFTADQWKNWVVHFSTIALRDIIGGEVMECWRHFVLACRTLCTKQITIEQVKLGDALLLQFCRRTERLFGKDCITPNMHLHCHLCECVMDYGPLHSFWCFAYERYNGILGAMPNNNRSIECQLMQRFLRESQALSFPNPGEFSEDLLPLFPKIQQTGSVADTMSSIQHTATDTGTQAWTLDSLGSFIQLPKFCSRCVLDSQQRACAVKLYCNLYSVSETEVDIAHTCVSYTSVVVNSKAFGTHKSRTASSSIVVANWDSSVFAGSSTALSGLRAARIEKFYKHAVAINGEAKVHVLASLSWFKDHPQKFLLGKPVTVWYFDLFEFCGLAPVQLLVSRAVSLVDKLNDETVLFVVPCLQ